MFIFVKRVEERVVFSVCYFFTGKHASTWYKTQRSAAYGRIKKIMNVSCSAPPPPVLKYRQTWLWQHLEFLKPHVVNKERGVIMSQVKLKPWSHPIHVGVARSPRRYCGVARAHYASIYSYPTHA